jgi:hypothetical protein
MSDEKISELPNVLYLDGQEIFVINNPEAQKKLATFFAFAQANQQALADKDKRIKELEREVQFYKEDTIEYKANKFVEEIRNLKSEI